MHQEQSELSDCLAPNEQYFSYISISWQEQVRFQWDDDDIHFVLDQRAYLDFYSSSSPKQQCAGRHVTTWTHDPDSSPTSICFYSLILYA